MPTVYNKPHLAISEQVRLLASRGMVLRDPALAAHWLGVVGYYRLSGYWYPYRRPASSATGRSDAFEPETTFEQVVALYAFDRKLKLLVLDALERVEIAVRFRVGYTLGRRGAYAHLDPDTLDGAFGRSAGYTTWKRKVDAAQTASREDFVQHFRAKYDGRLPVWVVTEILAFGSLSHLYAGLKRVDRDDIAREVGAVDVAGRGNGAAFANWLRVFNYLRNTCAHHSRLWNRNMTVQLAPRHLEAIGSLRQLSVGGPAPTSRPAGILAVLAYLVNQISPGSAWATDITALVLGDLPASQRQPREMGFPRGWLAISSTGAFTIGP
jgi:abortive infection bacteriophage resistance protein